MRLPLVLVALSACGDNKAPPIEPIANCAQPTYGRNVKMRLVAQVPDSAVLVTSPPRDKRLFVIQQRGAIRIIEDGILLPEPFIDLAEDSNGPVLPGVEDGLLGLAFHPSYATNGLFFVTYTARNPADPMNEQRNVLARCSVSADPNTADRGSCVDVLSIPDIAANHNGGMIEFGDDGYLYYATGDGGTGGAENAQALEDAPPAIYALQGKILRLDVDTKAEGMEYAIPPDNPFATGGGRPEIYISGLRNPWRWSFDRATGDMWIGDVGQKTFEEINVLRPHQQAGANLGWPIWEGSFCYGGAERCAGLAPFKAQDERRSADGWTSIIGGQVYRGSCFPDLQGTYFYTDHDDVGRLATATLEDDDTLTIVDLPNEFPIYPASLHEAAEGELYETDIFGNIFQLVVEP